MPSGVYKRKPHNENRRITSIRNRWSNPEDTFWSHVNKHTGVFADIDGVLSECWFWTGATDIWGYGAVSQRQGDRNRKRGRGKAHRIAWRLYYGEDPTLHVLHRCDNPPCVRKEHLRQGTNAENNQDCIDKGRHWTQKYITVMILIPKETTDKKDWIVSVRPKENQLEALIRLRFEGLHLEVRRRIDIKTEARRERERIRKGKKKGNLDDTE